MLEPMKTQTTGELTKISFTVPSEKAHTVCNAVKSILELLQAREEFASSHNNSASNMIEEAMRKLTPDFKSRGLQVREDLMMKRLAEVLGVQLDQDSEDEEAALFTVEEVIPESTPGFRLRGLRAREGLTQKQFAEHLGIRQHHVSEMERGKRIISLDMAKRIGDAYGLSYKVFL